MKGITFARVFETESGQILLTKGYDQERDQFTLNFQMDIESLLISAMVSSPEEGKIEASFTGYNQEQAESMAAQLVQGVQQLEDELVKDEPDLSSTVLGSLAGVQFANKPTYDDLEDGEEYDDYRDEYDENLD